MKNPFVKLFAISFLGALLAAIVIKSQDGETTQGTPLTCDSMSGQCDNFNGITLNFPNGIQSIGKVAVEFSLPEGVENLVPRFDIKLEGKTMYMGVNEFTIDRVGNTSHYQGEIRIPVCTTEKMDWLMSLSVPNSDVAPLVYEFSLSH